MPTTAYYTNLPGTLGGPLSIRRGGQSRFVLPDLQGNVRQLTDSAGVVTDTLTTDAFGVQKASSGGTVNPYKAYGQWGYFTDTPSRLYVRARELRVDLGRWISRDPDLYADVTDQYLYVRNEPINSLDPSGKIQVRPVNWPKWHIDPLSQAPHCCGKYSAYWDFILERGRKSTKDKQECVKAGPHSVNPCRETGVYIQKVEYTGNARGGDSCNDPVDILPGHRDIFVFWEAVELPAGACYPANHYRRGFTDIFNYMPPKQTCGDVVQTGDVRFFCKEEINLSGFSNDPACFAYSNPYLCTTDPRAVEPWWDDDRLIWETGIHSAEAHWGCCPKANTNRTDASPRAWWWPYHC